MCSSTDLTLLLARPMLRSEGAGRVFCFVAQVLFISVRRRFVLLEVCVSGSVLMAALLSLCMGWRILFCLELCFAGFSRASSGLGWFGRHALMHPTSASRCYGLLGLEAPNIFLSAVIILNRGLSLIVYLCLRIAYHLGPAFVFCR